MKYLATLIVLWGCTGASGGAAMSSSKGLVTESLTLSDETSTAIVRPFHADPRAGTGLDAPLGSVVLRTDAPGIYLKVGAAATAWTRLVSEIVLESVDYVATGAEGTDFFVPIGVTLPNAQYEVYWSPKGVAMIPVIDLPAQLPTDRTTAQFRVITSARLTAGDVLSFLIHQG